MNTFRFGYVTKKGISAMLGVVARADAHVAVTIEGREDAELPEQTLCAVRLQGLDIPKLAKDGDAL